MTIDRQRHQLALELERLLERAGLIAAAGIALEEAATSLLPDHPLTSMLVDALQEVAPSRHRLQLIKSLVEVIDGRAVKETETLSTR